jgi:hypothetical protein
MSLEGYKLAEAIIVSQHAEAIASYLGNKEKEDKYKKQKEKLEQLDEYESVTVFHILLAEQNLKKFTLNELINIANNLSDGSGTESGDTLDEDDQAERYFACQECCCIEDHRSICETLK